MRQYHIKVYGRLIPVSKAVYQAYYKAWRRERYLVERDEEHGLFSYHALDTDDFQGESIIVDPQESVEDLVIQSIMLDKLKEVLELLESEDKQLLLLLFGGMSERALSRELGISLVTLQRKRISLLE